ncbi:Lipase family [Cyanobium sp. PCC 7001]|uniref:lipase family protein n=1 Tax=Cyanobium sp. PCC 7001 TaxID=180281 RepID=UPI0001804EDF|nr:lipase [Cyanobium sp. PCC 7001]EDY39869.1 Lipase family [Cyanobium sp. PCC 7001]
MPDWSRRQVLLAGLGLGSAVSGVDALLRHRSLVSLQAQFIEEFLQNPRAVNQAVDNAINGDGEATAAVQRIQADLRLRPPSVPYDRDLSKTLILASRVATEQYLTGKYNLRFRGAIQGLPSFSERLAGYTQVSAIKGPEMVTAEKRLQLEDNPASDPLAPVAALWRQRIQGLAGSALVVQWSYPVYWGFVLTGPEQHLLVLRGTQRGHEWIQTINARQVVSRQMPQFDFPGAIHRGFATIYARLSPAVITAVRKLDPSKPLVLGGHSLGAPLASLAALDIAQRLPAFAGRLRLYTYAGPRLGNPAFATAFSQRIPDHYRVVNQADVVPELPPTKTQQIVYVHGGKPWGFTASRGDIGPNHFISAYRDAIDAEQEQPLPWSAGKPGAAPAP